MWKEVEMLMGQSSQNAYKLALLEADKILDYVMKKKMFAGTTMGERLKYAVYKYPDLKPVWRAHILRNKIAHETAFTVSSGQARDAIKEFKNALVRLGAL
jgi:hypothetical protein